MAGGSGMRRDDDEDDDDEACLCASRVFLNGDSVFPCVACQQASKCVGLANAQEGDEEFHEGDREGWEWGGMLGDHDPADTSFREMPRVRTGASGDSYAPSGYKSVIPLGSAPLS
jgi:hypothetical protein